MAIITQNNFPSPTQIAWAEKFLSIAVPNLIHGTMAVQKVMPSNAGYIYRQSRTNKLPLALIPIDPNGITGPAELMSRVDIDVRPQFFGAYMMLNEQCTLGSTEAWVN